MSRSQRALLRPENLFLRITCCLLALSALPSPVVSQELGRLFFTPERRQMLDRQRQLNLQERQEAPEASTLTINGVVARSSGKRTVWVNGVAQEEKSVSGEFNVIHNRKNPEKIVVQTGGATSTTARVGDTVSRNTGETANIIGSGKILINSIPSGGR